MDAIAVDRIVAQLLQCQQASMLDKTKCSMTARNVYNHLTGTGDMRYNDNLLGETRGTQDLLDELRAAERRGDGRVYYVHFDHVTGDSSHYFILLQLPGARGVAVLQSAVFEFSIRDWLDPGALEREARFTFEAESASLAAREPDAHRRELLLDAHARNRDFDLQTAANVRACCFGARRVVPTVDELERALIWPLQDLCGPWAPDNVERRCEAYRTIFGCRLSAVAMARTVRLGCNPAAVRYMSGPLAIGI